MLVAYKDKDNRIIVKDHKPLYAIVFDGKVAVKDERWITINGGDGDGQHVLIKENGDIVAGLGGKFGNLKELGDKSEEAATPITNNFERQKVIELNARLANITVQLDEAGVEYNEVQIQESPLTEDEIIKETCGADKTRGACASVAFAYIGQKHGLDVRDFRGGKSRDIIAQNCGEIIKACSNGKYIECDIVKDSLQSGLNLLKKVKSGKEYFFVAGVHAAIVRKKGNDLQYLYLQDSKFSGWENFELKDYYDTKDTLRQEFGCVKGRTSTYNSILIDTEELKNDDFRVILGYINTEKKNQRVRK